MHNTQGLEIDVVYLVGLQDGLFPRTFELNKEKIEEERRLFYVAITRAKRKLTLTTFNRRHQYGRTIPEAPSRFLSEIDSELIDSLSLYERSSFVGYGGVQQSNRYGEGQPRDGWQSSRRRMDSNGTLDPEDDAARFAVGMAVFNDDYGAGEVMERKKDGSQHILTVRFQSGKVAHFIEKYAALERIAAD